MSPRVPKDAHSSPRNGIIQGEAAQAASAEASGYLESGNHAALEDQPANKGFFNSAVIFAARFRRWRYVVIGTVGAIALGSWVLPWCVPLPEKLLRPLPASPTF